MVWSNLRQVYVGSSPSAVLNLADEYLRCIGGTAQAAEERRCCNALLLKASINPVAQGSAHSC